MRYYAKLKSSIKPKLSYSSHEGFKITNQRVRKIVAKGSVGKAGRTGKEYLWEIWVTILGNHNKFEEVFIANYEFIELSRILPKGETENILEINHCSEHECPANNQRAECKIQTCILIEPKEAVKQIEALKVIK